MYMYEDAWETTVDEVLSPEREIGNSHGTFTAVVRNSSEIVGHACTQIPVIHLFDIYIKGQILLIQCRIKVSSISQ